MPVEHVESASGFCSTADGRPTTAMPAAAAPKSAATSGSSRRGLALSDPNQRPCPTPGKRTASTSSSASRALRVARHVRRSEKKALGET